MNHVDVNEMNVAFVDIASFSTNDNGDLIMVLHRDGSNNGIGVLMSRAEAEDLVANISRFLSGGFNVAH